MVVSANGPPSHQIYPITLIDLERVAAGQPLDELLGEEDRAISVITVSELLHGALRATGARRARRRAFVEHVLAEMQAIPITETVARAQAEIWADLAAWRSDRRPRPLDRRDRNRARARARNPQRRRVHAPPGTTRGPCDHLTATQPTRCPFCSPRLGRVCRARLSVAQVRRTVSETAAWSPKAGARSAALETLAPESNRRSRRAEEFVDGAREGLHQGVSHVIRYRCG